MSKIAIDEEVLQQLLKQFTTKENKKRKEGSYQLYGNGKARLYYMLDRVPYRATINAKDDEEAEKQLALFVEQVKKGNFINTNYTFKDFAQIWLDEKIRPNAGERCVKKYIGALNTRILPYIGTIKLKDLTKTKSFHICMIMVIIVVILFVVGLLVLRYNVEGETNMPFNLSKIAIISTQEGIDDGQTNTRWSFDVHQSNDIYIYINKNDAYDKTEIIKSVRVDNFQIEAKNKDNVKLYKPDAKEENVIFQYNDEDIIQSLEYTGDVESDLKNLKISNQGGIIAFRCSNNNVTKYQSDEEEINHSELLKKAGVAEEDLKVNLAFYLTITLESGKQYQAEIKTELPTGNVIEEGNTSTEITNLEDIVFKRIHN